MRQKIIIIILLAILANFIFLSIVFSQQNNDNNGLDIQGIVPLTDANKNVSTNTFKNDKQTTSKENKYLMFFQKSWEKTHPTGAGAEVPEVQTIHDRVVSYGLMVLVLLVAAIFLIGIIRLFDKLVSALKTVKKVKFGQK